MNRRPERNPKPADAGKLLSPAALERAGLRYLERYAAGPDGLDLDAQGALAPVIRAAHDLAGIAAYTGRTVPDVVT